MKNITAILIVIFLTSCSGHINYVKKPTPIVKNESKYYVNNVNVKLNGDYGKSSGSGSGVVNEWSKFPNESEMSKNMKNILIDRLKEKNIYSENKLETNVFLVNLDVQYKRIGIFNKKNTFSSFEMSHNVEVYDQNKELVAQGFFGPYKVSYATYNCGLLKNIITLFGCSAYYETKNTIKVFAGKGPEDEIEEIGIVLNSLVKDIKDLGK